MEDLVSSRFKELLKKLSRGKKITKNDIKDFVNKLDINEKDKKNLLELEPKNYIGLCEKIIDKN